MPARRLRLLAGALVLVLAAPASVAAADARPDRIDGWTTASPGEVGLSRAALARHARLAKQRGSTCLAVVRRGKLAGDWNWGTPRTTPREVFSVTKSVTSTLVGIAAGDGLLELDDPVSRYVPQWRGTASADVTIRNLLSNDSGRFWSLESDYSLLVKSSDRTGYAVGLTQQHPAGSAWAYNNAAIQVLDAVLRRATGLRTDVFAQRRLFDPLGMTHTRMTRDSSGRSTNAFFGMQTTCLDLARLGRLFLQQGRVDGERVVPRAFVRAAVGRSSTAHNAAYGYLWWLNRPGTLRGPTDAVDDAGQPVTPRTGQLAPAASPRMFAALGLGGQVLLVDPGSGTIVVRLGTDSLAGQNQAFAEAAAVVTDAVG
ncbi:serine hydrolase domain-containing protein [Nocardioides currus]|nr:serine hydrolase domain-containing protein [Nocardioides currus]